MSIYDIKNWKFLMVLCILVIFQEISGQPIETADSANKNFEAQHLPITSSASNFEARWPKSIASNPKNMDEVVRKTRHIIGGGGFGGIGGFAGGFTSTGISAPIYSAPIITSVPVVTTIPVISTISTVQAVPAYAGGYGYGGYGAGGLYGGGLGFGKYHQSFYAKGFGIGGGFGGGFLG